MNHPRRSIVSEIEWIGQNKFDFIDLTFEPFDDAELNIVKIKNLLEKYHLEAIGHTNPHLPSIFPIDTIRDACINELKKSLEFFALLQIKKVNIHPFYYGSHFSDEEIVAANLKILKIISDFAKNFDVTLMLENSVHPFANAHQFKKATEILPDLKVHLDIGHCNLTEDIEETVQDFFNVYGKKITHLHIHDNHGKEDEHLPLGCGTIDWEKIIQIIKSAHYDGTITLEVYCGDRDYLLFSRDKFLKMWHHASSGKSNNKI